jgi:hypothetical protein
VAGFAQVVHDLLDMSPIVAGDEADLLAQSGRPEDGMARGALPLLFVKTHELIQQAFTLLDESAQRGWAILAYIKAFLRPSIGVYG